MNLYDKEVNYDDKLSGILYTACLCLKPVKLSFITFKNKPFIIIIYV